MADVNDLVEALDLDLDLDLDDTVPGASSGSIGSRSSISISERRPLKFTDLSNDVLILIFAKFLDRRWAIRTFPCVCRAWRDLFRSRDASPLHEVLEICPQVDSAAGAVGFVRRFADDVKTLYLGVPVDPDAS